MITACNGLRNEILHIDLFEEASPVSVYITFSRLHERVNVRQSLMDNLFLLRKTSRLELSRKFSRQCENNSIACSLIASDMHSLTTDPRYYT